MNNIITDKIYTPQRFIEKLTGSYYCMGYDNVYEEIQELLCQNGIKTLWNYSLKDVEYIVNIGIKVVLVEVPLIDDEEVKYEYRWFEVPEDKVSSFEEEVDDYDIIDKVYSGNGVKFENSLDYLKG